MIELEKCSNTIKKEKIVILRYYMSIKFNLHRGGGGASILMYINVYVYFGFFM